MGEKNTKTMTEKQLKARKMNAQKSTGPKTEAGKAVSSMNAVTTGEYIHDFYKIDGRTAGRMKLCDQCKDEQKDNCKQAGTCLMHKNLTYAYVQTVKTGNTKHLEMVNARQLATMDMIFTRQLRYAQKNLGETEEYYDQFNKKRIRQKISMDYLRKLMEMMEKLSKTLPDMQLTRRTQENIDVAWAELAKAEIDPVRAAETKQAIIAEMAKWRRSHKAADEMENEDAAIREYEKTEKKAADESPDDTNLSNISGSPFVSGNTIARE